MIGGRGRFPKGRLHWVRVPVRGWEMMFQLRKVSAKSEKKGMELLGSVGSGARKNFSSFGNRLGCGEKRDE